MELDIISDKKTNKVEVFLDFQTNDIGDFNYKLKVALGLSECAINRTIRSAKITHFQQEDVTKRDVKSRMMVTFTPFFEKELKSGPENKDETEESPMIQLKKKTKT